MFQRLLSALWQRVVLFSQHFTAQVKQGNGCVMSTQPHANGMEITGFGNDGDGAAAPRWRPADQLL
ncbi:Uncharacterised protein [Citrobacter koseri]|uniref:Uncharacterized protein n=1 Tax=Citrobacter koseri TaxID=545 RepID=A0A2X2UX19_CITKO|nr:Uncharacterised protein [Citrobacter koseri]